MRSCLSIKLKIFTILFILLILSLAFYSYGSLVLLNSIDVYISSDRIVDYGNDNYNLLAMVESDSGKISVLNDLNTEKIGEQLVLFEVKRDNIKKSIPVMVEVVDRVSPIIVLNSDSVVIPCGKNFDITSNISIVMDNVDGILNYVSSDENRGAYYTIDGYLNINEVGVYPLIVKAVDSFGNVTIKNFNVVVTSHGKENSIKDIAYSMLGKPYLFGGNTPAGFDCSGFVQYVYGQNGMYVGRNAYDQLYVGYEVPFNNIRVGDIIVWGYGVDSITHTAIYIGDGLMIHAANPNEGVIINIVDGWGDYNNVHIVSVRRLP